MNIDNHDFEIIIIGGSYAGLAAGLALGRSMRRTLIVDNGRPANRFTPHSHNLLTHDGETPTAIRQMARQDLEKYPTIRFLDDVVTGIDHSDAGFRVTTHDGIFNARKILFATGLSDQLPLIDGFSECWGKSILHCPYCHGYEYRQQPTGIFASGETAFELARLISNWTKELHVMTNGDTGLNAEMLCKLEEYAIRIHTTPVVVFNQVEGQLESVQFADGIVLQLNAVYARLSMIQQTNLPEKLGCQLTEHLIKVDAFQLTSVPGVYAAGDNSSMMRSLSSAIAAGTLAGASINRHLINEDF